MIDAIIISDAGNDTYSGSSPLRLQLGGKVATIQNIKHFIDLQGRITIPFHDEDQLNWHSAPKLNGIMLYSYLQKENYRVDLIDSYDQEKGEFIRMLSDNPKAVVISTTFISSKSSLNALVDDIRRAAPDIFIIAGGPFVFSSYLLLQRSREKDYDTVSPKDDYLFLSHHDCPDVDLYIVDKGGEQVLSEALRRIGDGCEDMDLPNTARLENGKYVFTERKNLDPPDIVIDWETLPEKIFTPGIINVQASSGCPFNCEFCNFVKDRRYTRIKPLEQLIRELKTISGKGVKYIRFVDDNFRLGKNDLNEVSMRFIEADLNIHWMSFIRASTLAKTDLELLRQSGCVETQMGIESADEGVLKNMNKHADPEMYKRVVKNLLDTGINCSCCFIAGFPGETEHSIGRTIDFIDNIPEDTQSGLFYWSMYPFLLVPLSPIYESRNKAKYQLEGYKNKWKHRTMNSEQAAQHIMAAFFKIKNASPIYSGDNINMLMALTPDKRKEFLKVRHELSKVFLREPLDVSTVVASFEKIFF